MEKKIYLSGMEKQKLRKRFGCTPMMIWKALNFKSDSVLARKIRFSALKHYGGVPSFSIPEFETIHNCDAMTQTFGDHISLSVCREDGKATVYIDNAVEAEYPNISVLELMNLQRELALRASCAAT